MSTFYFFDNHLTEQDIKVLHLYLDGVTEREIIKQTLPQGYDRMPIGKTAINKIMQKLRLTLCMPSSKAAAIEHKEQVLKNLSEHLEYRKRLKRFERREQKRLTKSMDVDMRQSRSFQTANGYGVNLYYYAQNSFGAMILNTAQCEFNSDGILLKVSAK